ncbi:hypothetical protein ACX7S9_000153 [Morganella morganii]|nr:hypothetical protein [Morganella morganii]EKU4014733.1 hypothetical protein [Morganella morganii]
MQLVVAIRNDYRRKVGISAVRYALDQLYRWNVIGRKRNSYNFVHWLRYDHREGLENQEQTRRENIAKALRRSHERSEETAAKPRVTERKPRVRQPIEQYGEPARMQKLFDSLLKKARNNAG